MLVLCLATCFCLILSLVLCSYTPAVIIGCYCNLCRWESEIHWQHTAYRCFFKFKRPKKLEIYHLITILFFTNMSYHSMQLRRQKFYHIFFLTLRIKNWLLKDIPTFYLPLHIHLLQGIYFQRLLDELQKNLPVWA